MQDVGTETISTSVTSKKDAAAARQISKTGDLDSEFELEVGTQLSICCSMQNRVIAISDRLQTLLHV